MLVAPARLGSQVSCPLISIVIPTFRRPDVLSEILTALQPQLSGTETEVLVVDNCPRASSRSLVRNWVSRSVRYIAEAKNGVVHARNRGLAEARGAYILFLDDDEVPAPTWLRAYIDAAERGVDIGFGRIRARYAEPPAGDVRPLLDVMFTRDFPTDDGSDITDQYADLGCGNAMFHRATCFASPDPFEVAYNRFGGEDSALIKQLVSDGVRLSWIANGLVEEVVPPDRQTPEYLKTRRYNQGRLRSRVNIEHSVGAGLMWMGVGAVQTALYSGLWSIACAMRSNRATYFSVQIQGGLGKVLWWRTPAGLHTYGT